MAFNHVFWVDQAVPHGCWLGRLSGFEKGYQIRNGVPRAEGWPSDVSLEMSKDFRKYTLTPDCVNSINAATIISERVVEFLREKELPNVEYLPVTILNHKGKAVDTPYFILHPVHLVDCLDVDACQTTFGLMSKKNYEKIGSFVPDESKCDDLPPIMRIAGLSFHVAVHRDLAREIDDAGFTGIGWYEPSDLVGKHLVQALPGFSADEAPE